MTFRIENLLAKLEEAYPDHIISGLNKQHKKWGETITELYRKLGYADNRSFLEAYGFQVKASEEKGGRPLTIDPHAVIEELKRRYPEGAMSKNEIIENNTDLPIKSLSNRANDYFGMPLGAYLKQQGILKRRYD